ncbi:hypothetical protein ACIRPQ_21320 [Streptomyces sp. NPDC101213]|uniref:hypothetical protein n=1 Tax=Streptomyces sp. NPDC101213 TaxID=3366130 RepID=UPI003805EAC3
MSASSSRTWTPSLALRPHGGELVGEIARFEDDYLLRAFACGKAGNDPAAGEGTLLKATRAALKEGRRTRSRARRPPASSTTSRCPARPRRTR